MTKVWIVSERDWDDVNNIHGVFSTEENAANYCDVNNIDISNCEAFQVDDGLQDYEPLKNRLKYWSVQYANGKAYVKRSDEGYYFDGTPCEMWAKIQIYYHAATWDIWFLLIWAKDENSAEEYARLLTKAINESGDDFQKLAESRDIGDVEIKLGTWQDALEWEQHKGETRTAE